MLYPMAVCAEKIALKHLLGYQGQGQPAYHARWIVYFCIAAAMMKIIDTILENASTSLAFISKCSNAEAPNDISTAQAVMRFAQSPTSLDIHGLRAFDALCPPHSML